MTDDTDLFTPSEQAQWDAMRNEAPMPEPEPEPSPAPQQEAPAVAEPAQATQEPESAAPATEAREDDSKTVPLATMLEERRKYEERIERLMAKLEPPKPAAATAPSVEIDPKNLTVEALQHVTERVLEIDRERAEQAEMSQVETFAKLHAAEFSKATPDFNDAYNHIRAARAEQLIGQGLATNPQELNARLRQEEATIIRLCASWGVNPAGFMYSLAQNAGYQRQAAPEPAAAAAATPPRGTDGKFLPAKADPKEKLKMSAEAQERASNPVSAAGAGTGGPIDLRALASMDGDDFDKATEGNKWRKLMGG